MVQSWLLFLSTIGNNRHRNRNKSTTQQQMIHDYLDKSSPLGKSSLSALWTRRIFHWTYTTGFVLFCAFVSLCIHMMHRCKRLLPVSVSVWVVHHRRCIIFWSHIKKNATSLNCLTSSVCNFSCSLFFLFVFCHFEWSLINVLTFLSSKFNRCDSKFGDTSICSSFMTSVQK